MNTWDLRAELLALTHRWYLILAILLAGGLVGWLVGYYWPGPYRASLVLFVGLDPHRTTQDDAVAMAAEQESFRNLDDYKNWQMNQLNTIIFTDNFLKATLEKLQSQDPYWEESTSVDMRDALSVRWRNAGRWVLIAEADRPERATQLVENWANVIVYQVSRSLAHAREVLVLEQQLESMAELQTVLEMRSLELGKLHRALEQRRGDLEESPQNKPLDPLSQWELFYLVAKAADDEESWQTLLKDIPPLEAPPTDYLAWLDLAIRSIEMELDILPDMITSLNERRATLTVQYSDEVQKSRALSANLTVEKQSDNSPVVGRVRPKGVGALIGIALGGLAWAVWALFSLTNQDVT